MRLWRSRRLVLVAQNTSTVGSFTHLSHFGNDPLVFSLVCRCLHIVVVAVAARCLLIVLLVRLINGVLINLHG